MITLLRKHNRWIMIVIAILAIPFVFYFNKTDLGAARTTDLGRIYDRPVTRVEYLRNARLMNLANSLGLTLGQELSLGANDAEVYGEFTWNRLVLHHEAEQLGIRPTQDEITQFVKTLRPFAGANGFELAKYTDFTQTTLPAFGFNEAQIEELVSDQLALNRVKDLLGSGIRLSESESLENYERGYGKLDVAVVRLNKEDFEKDLKIADEEIAKYFEAHKAELKSDEKRRIEFVTFDLTEADKKLEGKERVEKMQLLANYANDFCQALLAKDANFGEIAVKFKGAVAATGEFTAAAPDPKLSVNPQLAQYAFVLKPEEPYSDPIQGKDGFFVVHLLGVSEARPLTLEEAKPKIAESLKAERLRELMSNKGAEIARLIREGNGKPLDQIAQAAGLKLERVPPFALAVNTVVPIEKDKEPPKPEAPDLPMIKRAVSELSPGEVSEFVLTIKGGLVAVLEKREPIDPTAFAQAKPTFELPYIQQKLSIAFFEWLRERRRVAGVASTAST
ncbi:MAG: peptidylprolyl isomerase [Verrucomicrobiota bacterium]|nr:peptidylprolyl isomerase [Verrucomicrobiota bacterium]